MRSLGNENSGGTLPVSSPAGILRKHKENPDCSAQPLINQSVAPGYAGDNAAASSLSSLTQVRSCRDLHVLCEGVAVL